MDRLQHQKENVSPNRQCTYNQTQTLTTGILTTMKKNQQCKGYTTKGMRCLNIVKKSETCGKCKGKKTNHKNPSRLAFINNKQIGATQKPTWLNGTITLHRTNKEPALPVTSAFVFVRSGNYIALTNVTQRGWDLPGGHLDEGEEPLEAGLRELEEETNCKTETATPIAYAHINQEPSDKYPEESAMMFYLTETNKQKLTPSLECDDAKWIPIKNLRKYCSDKSWFPIAEQIFDIGN